MSGGNCFHPSLGGDNTHLGIVQVNTYALPGNTHENTINVRVGEKFTLLYLLVVAICLTLST